MGCVRNFTTGNVIATRVRRATGWWERLAGLMGRRQVSPEEGLWFDRCWAIHTVGVRALLDVLFLDRAGRVVDICVGVTPMRLAVTCPRAYSVLELGHGAVGAHDVLVGDRVQFDPASVANVAPLTVLREKVS